MKPRRTLHYVATLPAFRAKNNTLDWKISSSLFCSKKYIYLQRFALKMAVALANKKKGGNNSRLFVGLTEEAAN